MIELGGKVANGICQFICPSNDSSKIHRDFWMNFGCKKNQKFRINRNSFGKNCGHLLGLKKMWKVWHKNVESSNRSLRDTILFKQIPSSCSNCLEAHQLGCPPVTLL